MLLLFRNNLRTRKILTINNTKYIAHVKLSKNIRTENLIILLFILCPWIKLLMNFKLASFLQVRCRQLRFNSDVAVHGIYLCL